MTDIATNPDHLKVLETWMRNYKPEKLFDEQGRLIPELKALAPKGARRMSANPVANGGLLRRPLDMPDFRSFAVEVKKPGATLAGNVPTLGNFLREVMRQNMHNFRIVGPDETQSNKLEALYDVGKKVWLGEYFPEDADGGELAPNGRVMEMLSEHMGKDTHALSGPAQRTALEVLSANAVETIIQRGDGVTPTPVISRAILVYNRGRQQHLADGIVITPSHNPPEDGGFKYNPPNGGPADTDVTRWVQDRANELLRGGNAGVKRVTFEAAIKAASTHQEDFVLPYVRDLGNVVDMEAIRAAGLKLGVDPLGGAARPYWEPINAAYHLDIAVVNPTIDPTFSFMTVDHDGQIRMDCSSPYAMARLVGLKDQYRVAFANDPDSDRHGIVTPSAGLLNPNHYLAVAIRYRSPIALSGPLTPRSGRPWSRAA